MQVKCLIFFLHTVLKAPSRATKKKELLHGVSKGFDVSYDLDLIAFGRRREVPSLLFFWK